ncbi:MAG TPA: hypothetical protein VF267_08485 [Gammaproteobacteria bacterium]
MAEYRDMESSRDDAANNGEQRVWLIITYALHLFGAVLAVPSIIGLVMNYVFRDSAGAELRSHHDWMIRTFWWALAWTVFTWLLWITLIGIPVAVALGFVIWVWWIYRHVRGLIRLADRAPMPY